MRLEADVGSKIGTAVLRPGIIKKERLLPPESYPHILEVHQRGMGETKKITKTTKLLTEGSCTVKVYCDDVQSKMELPTYDVLRRKT